MNTTEQDWISEEYKFTDTQMRVRQQSLSVLLTHFAEINEKGTPKHSTKSIYECANEWVSKGNVNTNGILKYYEAYYA